jgi:methyl-accepting chemotaxis protein
MKNMTIGMRISLACAALVALAAGMGVSSLLNFNRVAGMTQTIVTEPLPSNYFAGKLDSGSKKILVWMNMHMQTDSTEQMAKLEALIEVRRKTWQEERKEFEKLVTSEQDRALFGALTSNFDHIMQAWDTKILPLSRAQKNKEAFAALEAECAQSMEELDKAATSLADVNRREGEKDGEQAMQAASNGRAWVWGMIMACVVCGALLSFFIVRGINNALLRAITELADGADQVAAAASEVSTSSQSLAQGSSEQAASIEQTSASSEEIHSMARKNAENSKAAADNMVEAAQKVEEANRNLGQMVTSMNEINASSDKISKIIKVIDEIAFQTNILALNAAVEAARAGEAGMGFAVVADEVRNLAQRCAQAAKDTAGLIEESIAKSNDGKTKLDQVATAVRSITDVANKVKTLVDEVSLGSQEQTRGIEQVSKAITQMEKVTQTTAANAEQSASASEELSAQSNTLRAVVERLNGMVGGGREAAGGRLTHGPQRVASRGQVAAAHSRTAAPHSSGGRSANELASAAVKADKNTFPLEEDFKEF